MLQDLCRQRFGWDDEIPLKELHRWREWLDDLSKLGEYIIDRCIKPKAFEDVVTSELHHFSDASEIGYGAVSYLRIFNKRAEIHCCLVMAKSRLAPIKPVTIPRMELSAAVLATRLDTMIRQEIHCNINQSYCWRDSMCVLRYIENDTRRFQTFVSNHFVAIRDVSSPSQWQCVDSNSNPADDASRGLNADELIKSKRWLHAPEILWGSAKHWPKSPASINDVEEDDPEVKKSVKIFAIALR